MKIKFVIGNRQETYASTWDEVQKYLKTQPTPDEETFIVFKALEKNTELEKEIKKSRKVLGLPEDGLTWEEYKNKDPRNNHTDEELQRWVAYIKGYPKEVSRIRRKMHLHPLVSEQLNNLILGGFVEPYYRGLGYGTNVDEVDRKGNVFQDGDVESVNIYISKKISRNELNKFIGEVWTDIKRLFEKLPPEVKFYVSQRDLRIVELRDDYRMKYKDIVEKILKEFKIDNLNAAVNEDSVKTSYKRAKEKIATLAQMKKK